MSGDPLVKLVALVCAGLAACAPPRSNPLDPKSDAARSYVNRPPELRVPEVDALAEGTTLVVALAAVDPEGEVVAISASGLPANAVFESGVLRFSPAFDQAGSYVVALAAADAAGAAASAELRVTVTESPDGRCLDQDGDGAFAIDAAGCASGSDCNDATPSVRPGGVERLCNGVDDDCDASTNDDSDPTDADRDGATVGCGDCDDGNAARSPSAPEIECNRVDEDCDPMTSDNPDADGDLFGVCVDCNDNDGRSYPRADEICGDGIDQDCDGAADDGC
jgi:hypothetical protein